MVPHAISIQQACVSVGRCRPSLDSNCLKIHTHGQWLYRNVAVHDLAGGLAAVQRKQELQTEIERQIELGGEGLEEQGRYLLEIIVEDQEGSSGGGGNTTGC